MPLPLFGLFKRKDGSHPWKQVRGSVPVPQHRCVVESQVLPWEAERGGNGNHLAHGAFR